MPPSIEEQLEAVRARDTDPAPEDPIITALRNMIHDHEQTERSVMAELRAGIREDFKAEAAKLTNPFLDRDEERRKQILDLSDRLTIAEGEIVDLKRQLGALIGDGR